MKKYLTVVFVAVFALVLTGCGKGNTLKCTLEEDGVKSVTTITFKGDKVSKVEATGEYKTKEEAEEAYSWMQLAIAFAGEDSGMKASLDGKKITVSMSGAALESEEEYKGSKAEIKKALEKEGYSCK